MLFFDGRLGRGQVVPAACGGWALIGAATGTAWSQVAELAEETASMERYHDGWRRDLEKKGRGCRYVTTKEEDFEQKLRRIDRNWKKRNDSCRHQL